MSQPVPLRALRGADVEPGPRKAPVPGPLNFDARMIRRHVPMWGTTHYTTPASLYRRSAGISGHNRMRLRLGTPAFAHACPRKFRKRAVAAKLTEEKRLSMSEG